MECLMINDSGQMLQLFTAKRKWYILEVDMEYLQNNLPFILCKEAVSKKA